MLMYSLLPTGASLYNVTTAPGTPFIKFQEKVYIIGKKILAKLHSEETVHISPFPINLQQQINLNNLIYAFMIIQFNKTSHGH